MIKNWRIPLGLFVSLVLFLACTTPQSNSVRKVQPEEAQLPAKGGMDIQKSAAPNGTQEKALRPNGNGSKAGIGTLPPAVQDVTPLIQNNKIPQPPPAPLLSWKDYNRARFPGKKVVFPDEIKKLEKKPEYQIGVDDVLSIMVWNHPDLTLPGVIVRKDGKISVPLVGNVQAEGVTIPELEENLKKGLTRFIKDPQVTVNPKEMNSQRIFLVGQIRKSMVTVGPLLPVFLLKGGNTLLEALSDIEFNTDADLAASYINRRDFIIPVNIKGLLMGGDLTQNVYLEPGDRIIVPGPMKQVTILGEVGHPDLYKVKLDTTLLDALSIAQGTKRETANLYMAYVARNRQILPVNLKRLLDYGDMSQNLQMEDGDLIFIPNSDEKKYYVLGEVYRPGVVYFRDPHDVIEAIAQGGGFLVTAQRKQVVLVRGDYRNPQVYAVDTLSMMQGKSFERFPVQKGDIVYVPRTLIADWNVFVNQVFPTFQTVVLIDLLRR